MFGFLKRRKKERATESGRDKPIGVPPVDPNSTLGHNQLLFDKLNRAIEADDLPDMPEPSNLEIAACEERRHETLARAQAAYDAEEEHEPWGEIYTLKRIQANQAIPVEVELWVDAVCKHYLHSAKPMMGLVNWEQGVRKRLYAMRGYEWYTISEIYPLAHFD